MKIGEKMFMYREHRDQLKSQKKLPQACTLEGVPHMRGLHLPLPHNEGETTTRYTVGERVYDISYSPTRLDIYTISTKTLSVKSFQDIFFISLFMNKLLLLDCFVSVHLIHNRNRGRDFHGPCRNLGSHVISNSRGCFHLHPCIVWIGSNGVFTDGNGGTNLHG